MPRKDPRLGGLIIKLQVANLICILLVFASAFWYHHMLGKIKTTMAKTPGAAEFDKKLSTVIGKPYTKNNHEIVATIFTDHENQMANLIKTTGHLSTLIYQLGGACFLLTSATIFFAVRGRAHPILPWRAGELPQ